MNSREAFQRIMRNNGGTFEWDSATRSWTDAPYVSGYYVAIAQHENAIAIDDFKSQSIGIFRNNLIAQGFLCELVGAWVSDKYSADCTVVLDSVMHIKSESIARELGRANGQHAIWDIANGSEIVIDAHV